MGLAPTSQQARTPAPAANRFRQFQDRYRLDPAGFVRDCITWRPDGSGPAPYQIEVLDALIPRRRASARGPHGLGKSAMAAWIILWFALTRDGSDWKIPTTASVWRQLTKYLWPEIHKWSRRLRWDVIGRAPFNELRELLQLSLHLSTGEAFALASDDPTALEGAHADHLLYVFDESKAIPDAIFDAAEGALSTPGEIYVLAISTPGLAAGRFYQIHARKPGYEDWWVRHVTRDEVVAAGRMMTEWAEQRKRQWGESSELYQNRVLGEFSTSSTGGVIPLAWVEAAVNRWHAMRDAGAFDELKFTGVGVDVAYGGDDDSTQALRFGNTITELRHLGNAPDTMALAGATKAILDLYGGYAVVDVIGWGAGVCDRLREQACRVIAFNAGESKSIKEMTDRSGELHFVDKRSAAWWGLRERLDPINGDNIALPQDDMLIGDLTAPKWTPTSDGKIKVESKDELRKPDRLGRSTDAGDAVVMAFWEEADSTRLPEPGRAVVGRMRG